MKVQAIGRMPVDIAAIHYKSVSVPEERIKIALPRLSQREELAFQASHMVL